MKLLEEKELKKLKQFDSQIDYKELIKKVNIFSEISKEKGIFELIKNSKIYLVTENSYLMKEGEVEGSAFIILYGSIEISKKSLCDDDIVVASLTVNKDRLKDSEGSCPLIGEQSLVSDEPRTATVKAVTDLVVLKLEAEEFLNTLNAHPKIGMHVYKIICRTLQNRLKIANTNVVSLFEAYLDTLDEDLMLENDAYPI